MANSSRREDTVEGYICALCRQAVTQYEIDCDKSHCCKVAIFNENEEYAELADVRPNPPGAIID